MVSGCFQFAPLSPVVSRGLPLSPVSPVVSRCLPLFLVVSRCLPLSPVVSRCLRLHYFYRPGPKSVLGLCGLLFSPVVSCCPALLAFSSTFNIIQICVQPLWSPVVYRCPVVSGCLPFAPLSPVVSRCLPWSPVVSRGLPWSPVVSRGLPWSPVVSRSSSIVGSRQRPIVDFCTLLASDTFLDSRMQHKTIGHEWIVEVFS